MLPKGSFATLANGFQFHYHDGGQGDVVLFLHGSGTGASGLMLRFRCHGEIKPHHLAPHHDSETENRLPRLQNYPLVTLLNSS